jgi:hypothetical protein
VVAFTAYITRKNSLHAVLLGIALGLSWLVKGIMMPLTLIIGLFLLIHFYRSKNMKQLQQAVIVGLVFIFTLAPYVLYQNTGLKKRLTGPYLNIPNSSKGDFIFISTQGRIMLLESHNEYIKYGFWSEISYNNPNSFYARDGMAGKPQIWRVVNFYKHFPARFFRLMKEKISSGFLVFYSFWGILLLFLFDNIRLLLERYRWWNRLNKVYLVTSMLAFLALFELVVYKLRGNVYGWTKQPIFELIDAVNTYFVIGLALVVTFIIVNYKKSLAVKVPHIFAFILLNFALMIILSCVPRLEFRYVKVIENLFILFFFTYFIQYARQLISSFKKQFVLTDEPD